MREAFSMITAIFVMVLVAAVGAFIMNLSGKIVQETTVQYRKEQAILYAKSYTEFAIMAATAQDCVRGVTANVDGNENDVMEGNGYRVIVQAQYIGNDTPANCSNELGGAIAKSSSRGNIILIDTYVHYRDPDHPDSSKDISWSTNPGTTYHRRTIQRL